MIEFEKELLKSRLSNSEAINEDDFISRLHDRVIDSEQRERTVLTSFLILLVIGFSTFTQLGVPLESPDIYFTDDASGIFETDFLYTDSDSLNTDEEYMYDIAYFLLQEGDFWNIVELLNTFEKETNL